MSNVIRHERCPVCAAAGRDTEHDNLGVYDDGHTFCFSCHEGTGLANQDAVVNDEPVVDEVIGPWTPLKGEAFDLPGRALNKATLQRFGVVIASTTKPHKKIPVMGTDVLVFPRYRDGVFAGQKLKTGDKQFASMGSMKNSDLFGQHLWKPKGKRVIVTEGEEDAMSMSQVTALRWPVVSLPDGTGSCEAAIRRASTWLNTFDEVIFMFDNDDAGKAAAIKAAAILKPGKAYIVELPLNDANEMLVAGRGKELSDASWQGREQRPDGLVHVKDVDMATSFRETFLYPFDDMNIRLYGRRSGELVINCSGAGMGKTSVLFEMMYQDLQEGLKVGGLFLEMPPSDLVNRLIGMYLGKPVQLIMAARQINENLVRSGRTPIVFGVVDNLTAADYQEGYEWVKAQGLILYNHFGSQDSPTLLRAMEHLAVADECPIIYLDHISIVISGQDTGNERLAIDNLMTNLASLTERTGCHIQAVSHLKRKQGTSHEEGGQVSLADLRGSGALGQLSHSAIGYERNQQHPDQRVANTIAVRSLKARFNGFTGLCAALYWNSDVGRLEPVKWEQQGKDIVFTYSDGYEGSMQATDSSPFSPADNKKGFEHGPSEPPGSPAQSGQPG